MICDRLPRLRERAGSLFHTTFTQQHLQPPSYENDPFVFIYKHYEKIFRQSKSLNKMINDVVELFDKKRTLATSQEVTKAGKTITRHLSILPTMINEMEVDIRQWQKNCDLFKNKKDLDVKQRVELSHELSAVSLFSHALRNYLSMRYYIDEKTENDIKRHFEIANVELTDKKLTYYQEHSEKIEGSSIYDLQSADNFEAQITQLEIEVAEITRQMKDLNTLTIMLYGILKEQSRKIRNIEALTESAKDYVESGNVILQEAQVHQKKTPLIPPVCRI